MTKMIFVNLPVADLPGAVAFYEAVGFTPEPKFTDPTAAAMVWSESIFVMLLSHAKWNEFTTRPIAARGSSEVSLALSLDSREAVDAFVEAAGRAGGAVDVNPVQDHGFMYGRDVTDPDDHVWGPFWMDPEMASGDSPPPA